MSNGGVGFWGQTVKLPANRRGTSTAVTKA